MYEERRAEALTTAQVEADETVCGSFPRKLAWEQLRRLRKRSYNGTVEDAEKSNSAHVAAAASTTWEHVPRLPQHVHNLVRSGKGCPVVRQQVSAGLIPGSPFGSISCRLTALLAHCGSVGLSVQFDARSITDLMLQRFSSSGAPTYGR